MDSVSQVPYGLLLLVLVIVAVLIAIVLMFLNKEAVSKAESIAKILFSIVGAFLIGLFTLMIKERAQGPCR